MMKPLVPVILLALLPLGAANADALRLLKLQSGADKAIQVPQQAVHRRDGIPGVFVLQNDEARFRMVRLGAQRKQQVKVLSGLFGNETLILADDAALYDGMPVSHTAKDNP